MKHQESPQIGPKDVQDALSTVGISGSDEALSVIALHANAVLEENQRMNLTRVTEPADVLRLHIADSATATQALGDLVDGPIADIGSGAGYPGVVLNVLTGRPVTLVESVKKKAAFLARVSEELALQADVLAERAEDVGREHPAEFACVVARALSSLPALVELAAPLLVKNGRLVAMKGPIDPEELRRGDAAGKICGMTRSALYEFELSEGEKRTIVCYDKKRDASVPLPRRSGMAQRHPLA